MPVDSHGNTEKTHTQRTNKKSMPILQSTLNVEGEVIHVLLLKDRRGRRPYRDTRWVFARQI